jgi:hypothetical protein
MSGTIFLAGILQFQSRERFEEAIEALRTEETFAEHSTLVPAFEEAMISETIMVLRHTPRQSGAFFDRLMAEAYLLSEFAGRGYIAGILRDARPRVQVAMAAMSYPAIDPYRKQADPDPATDYLPRLTGQQLTYLYRSEGREVEVSWVSRKTVLGKYDYISFPQDGSDELANDWWDGHYFLKSGQQWFAVTTDLDQQALSDPADEELQVILDGAAKPGQIFFSYVPGTESFRLYTHEGFEDVETPHGEFLRCMKVRIDLYFLPTEESRYQGDETEKAFKKVTTTHYFGKGAGLVKLVFEDGELVLSGMREVAEPAAQDRPSASEGATARASAPSAAREDAPAKRGRPWWKFW